MAINHEEQISRQKDELKSQVAHRDVELIRAELPVTIGRPCVTMIIAEIRRTNIEHSRSRGDGVRRRAMRHVELTWKESTRARGSHSQPGWRMRLALLAQRLGSRVRPAWPIGRHPPPTWKGWDDRQSRDPYKGPAPRSRRRRPCTQEDRRNQYTEASTRPGTHPRAHRLSVFSRRRRVHMLAAVSPQTWRH